MAMDCAKAACGKTAVEKAEGRLIRAAVKL
jgi:hypothetical protein